MFEFWSHTLIIAFFALLLDALIGYPQLFYRYIRHPVVWIGALITLLERMLLREGAAKLEQLLRGGHTVILLMAVIGSFAFIIIGCVQRVPGGIIIEIIVVASFIATRSLYDHVRMVERALGDNLQAGRDAVSSIVGRDPQQLDQSGVARAAIESLAENTSDGIIAPLFWLLIGGLPALMLYKAINTADSMIGYKNERYQYFGRIAARLDDVVNLPASRLTALLFIVTAALFRGRYDVQAALQACCRDASYHSSPNAGWPEAAMAGALSVSLGGPRYYHGEKQNLPFMGNGRKNITLLDLKEAIALFMWAMSLLLIFLFVTFILLISL